MASLARINAVQQATSRRTCVVVRAEQTVPRRALLSAAGVSALVLLGAQPSLARDFKAALAAKEARKEKLKTAADDIKTTGKDQQVFKDSDYMVSEDARTPNIRSREGEGSKTQINV